MKLKCGIKTLNSTKYMTKLVSICHENFRNFKVVMQLLVKIGIDKRAAVIIVFIKTNRAVFGASVFFASDST